MNSLVVLGICFISLILSGMPVGFLLGITSTLTLLYIGNVPLIIVPKNIFLATDSFIIMSVPFFILAGNLMGFGGITHKLILFSNTIVGHLKGGLAHVNVLVSMFFAGISGSATADVSAIGGILIPAMEKDGYDPGFTVGITASSSTVGPLIPPSIGIVVYASLTGLSVGQMFIGGIIPGILVGVSLMIMTYIFAIREGWKGKPKSSFKEIWVAFKGAIWALVAPVIILGGILTGVFTATEAGVVACVYCFFVSAFVYKELKMNMLKDIIYSSARTTSVAMIIVANAKMYGWVLAREKFPQMLARILLSITDDPRYLLFILIGLLFLAGLFVEALALKIILIPAFVPIAQMMNYNPLHFGLVFHMSTLVGAITPPVCLLLYLACSIARIPLSKAIIWPFVLAYMVALLVVALFPETVLFLPRLFMGAQ